MKDEHNKSNIELQNELERVEIANDVIIERVVRSYKDVMRRLEDEDEATVRSFYKGVKRGIILTLQDLNIEVEGITYDRDRKERRDWEHNSEDDR